VKFCVLLHYLINGAAYKYVYYILFMLYRSTIADREMCHVRSIRYLSEDKDSDDVFVYPDPDNSRPLRVRSLDAERLREYESFVPFSSDRRTGHRKSLSFCTPMLTADLQTSEAPSSRRRSQQDIAADFVQVLKELSFV
jgi:hypothetical protein